MKRVLAPPSTPGATSRRAMRPPCKLPLQVAQVLPPG